MFRKAALMLLGLDDISEDRRLAQGLACFEPVQSVDQHKTIAVAPDQDWRLLPDFQHALRDLLHGLRFEQGPALHRYINVRDLESFSLHHDPVPPSIGLGIRLCFAGSLPAPHP